MRRAFGAAWRAFKRRYERDMWTIGMMLQVVSVVMAAALAFSFSQDMWNLLAISVTCVTVYLTGELMRYTANRAGHGREVPRPHERYTERRGDEVTMDGYRLQEMLLYMADLEDWLEMNPDGTEGL